MGFLVVLVVKNLPANAGETERGLDPWVRKFPWRRKWEPTPVFLPGESLGQRTLGGYSPWSCKELRHVCSNLACRHVNARVGGGDYPHPCDLGHTNWVRGGHATLSR